MEGVDGRPKTRIEHGRGSGQSFGEYIDDVVEHVASIELS